MTTLQSKRKDEHVEHALNSYTAQSHVDFQQTHFIHHALPEINEEQVCFKTKLDTLSLDIPFFINAMTGGSSLTQKINADLAMVARETGLVMATGSLSVALKEPSTANSFKTVRQIHKNGMIFANLGAHHSVDNALRAIDLLEADALQIHVNVAQELVMPEGDRHFVGWLKNIEAMVHHLSIPVIVKEVGFGMSRETITQLESIGVNIIDVAGNGGTNFVNIENARRQDYSLALLQDWGQSTVISLLEAMSSRQSADIIASGGIKTPMDTVKSLALGANAVGLSGQFLHYLQQHGVEATIQYIQQFKETLKTIMTLLGAKNITELQQKQLILAPTVQNWCNARHIDWQHYANR